MKSISWSKASIKREDWDFSFCLKWPPAGIRSVWEHEASRELGVTTKRFCEITHKMEAAESEDSGTRTSSLIEAEFSVLFHELHELQDRSDSGLIEELGMASRRRVSSTSAMHLLIVDYGQSNRELLKQFSAWLKRQRSELGIPSRLGRKSDNPNDFLTWLDDLAMYRFRKAGISPKRAMEVFGFTPYTRELEENPTTAFAYGEKATNRRLKEFKRFFESEVAPS